jgi:hypothetical protein
LTIEGIAGIATWSAMHRNIAMCRECWLPKRPETGITGVVIGAFAVRLVLAVTTDIAVEAHAPFSSEARGRDAHARRAERRK